MINVLWIVVLTIAIVLMVGAGIVNAKKDKAFHSNIKELNKDQLELIYEIEVNMGLRRGK